jgi:isochorismate hydrolase
MSTTALLVMDVQRGIVDRYAPDAGYVAGLRRAVQSARAAGVRVIYVMLRVSAFSGSDLELRAANIDTLVLAGIATSGVVLSTLRQAADLDLRVGRPDRRLPRRRPRSAPGADREGIPPAGGGAPGCRVGGAARTTVVSFPWWVRELEPMDCRLEPSEGPQ